MRQYLTSEAGKSFYRVPTKRGYNLLLQKREAINYIATGNVISA